MRVTNQMMTNSALINVGNNKTSLNRLEEQYTTGKKIQKPSDDPIIAVRALKLRTTMTEVQQYKEKNIPDAQNWMDVTEGALSAISEVMGKINTLCVQGANDPLSTDDRDSIVQNLKQYKDEIYKQGNSDYAGRYVFTGYKTNKSLIYTEADSSKQYTITQHFTASDLEVTNQVTNTNTVPTTSTPAPTINTPAMTQTYRTQLAYDNLYTNTTPTVYVPTITTTPASAGAGITITPKSSADTDAYTFTGTGPQAHYIADTGEIVYNKEAYDNLKTATNINIQYDKKEFKEGDVRPEDYFDCTSYELDSAGAKIATTKIDYKSEDQQIQYEINYNQKLTVNTQAKDAIKPDMGRTIDDIINAMESLKQTETKQTEAKKRLDDGTLTQANYDSLKEQLDTEKTLKTQVLKDAYNKGISVSKDQQNVVNVENSDLGSRYVRLQLVESRLDTQSDQVEELMSNNEDVDLAEIIIRFNSAQTLYNSSLSATAKTLTNSLLDFI
ncbi:flagellar hook-associated protein FlgL [Anaeromicropila herbilytica]|uniref:Flagellar hook-associated protein 3 n=1 Tax=Anaeromicropila herbilytica TaxID=2785025 RepID=A0A7R7EPE0_9FIRM|nr:flagellar hook-associated protein FlgL [Anaeromicropila herbilytica]BCN32559.1 hypothetical protein bsdtb5_38540 [Anaeromicropila herbilytica]